MKTVVNVAFGRRERSISIIVLISGIALFLAVPLDSISPEKQKDLKSRKSELQKLNESIKSTRNKINNLSKKEKSTLKTLHTYQKHSINVRKYISLIDEELGLLQDSIDYLGLMLKNAGSEMSGIKHEYTQLASNFRKNSPPSVDEVIILKKHYAGCMAEEVYLKAITKHTGKKVNEIGMFIDSTELLVRLLYDKTLRQEELRKEKESENQRLNRIAVSKKTLLNRLRKDKVYLNRQLKQKKAGAQKLQKIIAGLMKQDDEKHFGIPEELPIGSLKWPTGNRKILRKFGLVKNKATNTVFDNPGIDISAKHGSPVYASASGKVSLIEWLPGYGSLIIVNHGKGVRTVYANLSTVSVKKGQSISAGTLVGRTGESVDGEFIHFEVWIGSKRLNPTKYLR